MSQEDVRRKLAEMKAYLEKRLSELNKESAALGSFLQAIDSLLAERSFRRIEIPKGRIESETLPHPELKRVLPQEMPMLSVEGVDLGELFIEGRAMTFVPDEGMRFEVKSPPLRSFLIARVLEPMKAKDSEMSREGKIRREDAFTYQIDEENGTLKALVIHNFGDEKRLLEIQNALRWTLRRMHEKKAGK
jgi:hypothetical protein